MSLVASGGALAVFSRTVFENSWPLFLGLGLHLSFEAVEKKHAKPTVNPDNKDNTSLRIDEIVNNAYKAIAEISGALVSYIFTLPPTTQGFVLVGFAGLMTTGYKFVDQLLKLQKLSLRLQAWEGSDSKRDKILNKLQIPQLTGKAIQSFNMAMFESFAVVVRPIKSIIGGRVLTHAMHIAGVDFFEHSIHEMSEFVEH